MPHDADLIQTRELLAQAKDTRRQLEAQQMSLVDIDSRIADLEGLLIELLPKAEAPPQVPSRFLPTSFRTNNRSTPPLTWPVFWYCGGFYAAPAKDSLYWPHFVAAVGQSVSDDPAIYKPLAVKEGDEHAA